MSVVDAVTLTLAIVAVVLSACSWWASHLSATAAVNAVEAARESNRHQERLWREQHTAVPVVAPGGIMVRQGFSKEENYIDVTVENVGLATARDLSVGVICPCQIDQINLSQGDLAPSSSKTYVQSIDSREWPQLGESIEIRIAYRDGMGGFIRYGYIEVNHTFAEAVRGLSAVKMSDPRPCERPSFAVVRLGE